MEAHELEAADRLAVDQVNADLERIFGTPKQGLAGLLKAVEDQLTYPSLALPLPAPKRGLWGRVKSILTRKA